MFDRPTVTIFLVLGDDIHYVVNLDALGEPEIYETASIIARAIWSRSVRRSLAAPLPPLCRPHPPNSISELHN